MAWKPESGAFCLPPGFALSLPHCSPHFSINFSSPQTHPQFCSRPTSCISNFWSCLFFSCDFPLQWARRRFSETHSFFVFFSPPCCNRTLKTLAIFNFSNYSEGNGSNKRGDETVSRWLAAGFTRSRWTLFTVPPSLYNGCCLRTYRRNLSCQSCTCAPHLGWLCLAFCERSTHALSDRWILITAGLWHPFSSRGGID